jgi:hypothetical protein
VPRCSQKSTAAAPGQHSKEAGCSRAFSRPEAITPRRREVGRHGLGLHFAPPAGPRNPSITAVTAHPHASASLGAGGFSNQRRNSRSRRSGVPRLVHLEKLRPHPSAPETGSLLPAARARAAFRAFENTAPHPPCAPSTRGPGITLRPWLRAAVTTVVISLPFENTPSNLRTGFGELRRPTRPSPSKAFGCRRTGIEIVDYHFRADFPEHGPQPPHRRPDSGTKRNIRVAHTLGAPLSCGFGRGGPLRRLHVGELSRSPVFASRAAGPAASAVDLPNPRVTTNQYERARAPAHRASPRSALRGSPVPTRRPRLLRNIGVACTVRPGSTPGVPARRTGPRRL